MSLIPKIYSYGSLIRFSHTIFALPFVIAAMALIARERVVSSWQIGLIVLAVVSARAASMAFNRIVDLKYDKLNPRTLSRELPKNKISLIGAVVFFLINLIIFILSAWGLGAHCLWLAPPVLLVLLGYSYSKRFTRFSHLILGIALSLAPLGAVYALSAQFDLRFLSLALAIIFWVAGFDIIYALVDLEFDRSVGLHSLPAYYGERVSRLIAIFFHVLATASLIVVGKIFFLNQYYFLAVAIFAFLISAQHLSPKINFTLTNGLASVVIMFGVLSSL
ncbi:MAG TPA: UbiA-like polyprenyltransferase [Oligoflexia bacterium]|nr:UbiA-like polyprenyltransferase [Oligoflexia bacterium]HMP27862.1 UbiA-like polyprenyltransferase [Oligoflexia bacterium]